MAIVAEEKKDDKQQFSTPAAPMTGGGTSTQQGGGRLASYSTGSQPASGSGRFTNLQSYIKANEGAGQQLGSKIGAGLEKETKKATDVSQAQAIGQQVQAEKDRLSQQGNQFNTQLKDQSGAQNIAANQEQRQQFSNLMNQKNQISNLTEQANTAAAQQANALNQAQQNVGQLGTETGRFNLLQNTIKNPTYSTGQQRLDQLFLQAGSPQDLVNKQRELSRQLGTGKTAAEQQYAGITGQLGQAQTEAQNVSNLLKGTLAGEESALTEAQRKEAEQLNSQNILRNAALETYFKSGLSGVQDPAQQKYIQDMLQSGGLQSGMRTYNVLKEPDSYKNYATLGGVGYKAADVMNQQELDRYNALRQLAEAQGPAEFTQVGAGGVTTDFRGQQLASDIQSARSALEQELGAANLIKQRGAVTTTSNLMDLLKYQEGQNFGQNLQAGPGANYVPIYQNWNADRPAYMSTAYTQENPYYQYHQAGNVAPWQQNIAADASSYVNANTQEIIQEYLNRLNQAGYDNRLGGVTGPTPTNTFNVK